MLIAKSQLQFNSTVRKIGKQGQFAYICNVKLSKRKGLTFASENSFNMDIGH